MRVVTDRAFSAMLAVYSEILMRSTHSAVKAEQQLWLTMAVLNGSPALQFRNRDRMRYCFVVLNQEMPYADQYLTWFALEHQVEERDEGNIVPILDCPSAFYVQQSFCITAVEDFIVNKRLPENVMPNNHHQLLTG